MTPIHSHQPFSADSINLVDEDDTGTVLIGHPEQLPHQLGTVSEVLLDQLTSHLANDTQVKIKIGQC